MILTLFDIIINFYQGFLIIYYMRHIFDSDNNSLLTDTIFVFLIGTFFSLYLFLPINIPDTVVFIIPLIYASLTKRGTWATRLFWITLLGVVWTGIVSLLDAAYSNILNISSEIISANPSLRLGYMISCNIALTISTFLMCNFLPHRTAHMLSRSSLFIFLLLLMSEFFLAEIIFNLQYAASMNTVLFMIASITLLILAILSVLIYEIMSSTAEKKRIAELKLKTNILSQEHQNDMKAMYEGLLASQHDLRNRIAIAEHLIESKNMTQDAIINGFICSEDEWKRQFITGNMTVDAILTAKTAVMDSNNIKFLYQPYPLQQLPIDEQLFGIMLSNILDNAIEGVLRLSDDSSIDRTISLKFARSWNMFFLVCTNPFNPSTIQKRGNRFISSKSNAYLHGLATLSIKQTVESNHGKCTFSVSDELFTVKIILPDSERNYDKKVE